MANNNFTIGRFMNGGLSFQKTADYVQEKINQQGGISMNDHLVCAYRSKNGCKCAVGHLIPDSQYDPSMDDSSQGINIETILKNLDYRDKFNIKDIDNLIVYHERLEFLTSLQSAHDNCEGTIPKYLMEQFNENMEEVREIYNLEPYTGYVYHD